MNYAADPDAEAQLQQAGLTITDHDIGNDDPGIVGAITVRWADLDHEQYAACLLLRPGVPPETRAVFATWARDMLLRWMQHGPDVDGWQPRETDAGWQLWARLARLPSLD